MFFGRALLERKEIALVGNADWTCRNLKIMIMTKFSCYWVRIGLLIPFLENWFSVAESQFQTGFLVLLAFVEIYILSPAKSVNGFFAGRIWPFDANFM